MSEERRKFQGVWIPADMWLDRSLSITEKVMLVEIGSLESEDRGCYKSNAEFAEFFGLSASRVSEIISGLAAKHFVTVELVRDGKRVVERRIRLAKVFEKPSTPYSENTANLFGKGGEGYSEKAEESNTRSNTKRDLLDGKPSDGATTDEKFEEAWRQYPRREGGNSKKAALKAWNARVREGIDPDVMTGAVKAYAKVMQDKGNVGTPYVKQASTFFGPDRHFDEYAGQPQQQADLLAPIDASAPWWRRAGFEKEWQAINAGCTEQTLRLWRDGRPIRKLAGSNVEPWPEVLA